MDFFQIRFGHLKLTSATPGLSNSCKLRFKSNITRIFKTDICRIVGDISGFKMDSKPVVHSVEPAKPWELGLMISQVLTAFNYSNFVGEICIFESAITLLINSYRYSAEVFGFLSQAKGRKNGVETLCLCSSCLFCLFVEWWRVSQILTDPHWISKHFPQRGHHPLLSVFESSV